jgi:uncharacterized protein YlxW (UPF0749 family)
VNPVFPQHYLTSVLPQSTITEIEENAVSNFKISPELCTEAENVCIFDTTQTSSETYATTTNTADQFEKLSQGQALLSYQIEEQFKQLSNQISNLQLVYSTTETTPPVEIDPLEQRRLEIQAQIEALQSEMQNL